MFRSAFAALDSEILRTPAPLRAAITAAYRLPEKEMLEYLLAQVRQSDQTREATRQLAHRLVASVREQRTRASGVDALMHEFSLSSEEGVALMCLAEALLRIPDHQTADRLIADKISRGDWRKHLGESPSLFVNAATWGLLITGKLVGTSSEHGLAAALGKMITKGGEPLIRKGVDLAMRMLGNQFVTGQTIGEAVSNSQANEQRGYRYSYDMLGEAALTDADACSYLQSYEDAIHAIGKAAGQRGIEQGPGISVKLSALHPRYSRAQRPRVMAELLPRLKNLLLLAKRYNIGLNIDAEEADRLELSLDLIEALAWDKELDGFDGMGIVVQAYQKRCPFVIDYLLDLARRSGRKFMVRLVKGAYWDSEIKRAQVDGLNDYPVYTRKVHTDVSYLVCAQKLLAATDLVYPQFATHNAHSVACIYTWAQERNITHYEFQCLHGMGESLYDQVVGAQHLDRPCRIYAPVGSHQTLLAYLVRRLLENGANSSFVNQIVDQAISIDTLIADPFVLTQETAGEPHAGISLPPDLFGQARKNSLGLDLANEDVLRGVGDAFASFGRQQWQARPLIAAQVQSQQAQTILNPADHADVVGQVIEAGAHEMEAALNAATAYAMDWQTLPPSERAAILVRGADLLETHRLELVALAIREAGKSLANGLAEVREAVDFLRFYAVQVANEPNELALGVVVCISPWNFPLAIFLGQISAALAAGNVVLAKPAEQTPLIACRAVQLLYEAGVPQAALQFLPGRGETIGAGLVSDHRVHGVIFTGSTEVARSINRTLAQRAVSESCDLPLIAETGGQNAMIVDSSALPEQVVQDILMSAFDSAGQRCSALRVLCVQEEIADKVLHMLKGAMHELRVGNPASLQIDVGPVIDTDAQQDLLRYIEQMRRSAKEVFQLKLEEQTQGGSFVAPTVIEVAALTDLKREVFGPVLHVLRYRRENLPGLLDAINAGGYGLTMGIHSRIDETINFITSHAHVGNIYVNRNMVGAVVGVQPFGGEGQSGTGPKAGGPLYVKRLQRLAHVGSGVHTIRTAGVQRPQLDQLLSWAVTHGHTAIGVLGEQYRRHSLVNMTEVLPGPTGERNTLSFAARGTVLCAAGSVTTLLNQLAAIFATGNEAAVLASSARYIPEGLPAELQRTIHLLEEVALKNTPLCLALVEPALRADLRIRLADRDGALVQVIETENDTLIPLWRLVAERALCVNTTAAGGNASLMTISG